MADMLSRFGSIMSANINALLDKAEDPEKMIDQNLRELREDLAEVKEQTANVIAEENRAKRALDQRKKDIANADTAARNALASGHEDDARLILQEKQKYTDGLNSLQEAYDAAHANSEKMKAMYNKLVNDISSLEARKEGIKGKIAAAKAQEKINKMTSDTSKANSSIEDFDRWEAKADKMIDAANAESELNAGSSTDQLIDKYKSSNDTAVDDEIAKMKAEMGL